MSKRGRPLELNPKSQRINFRLRQDQADMLSDLSNKTGKSKTTIFTELLKKEHERIIEND